MNAVALIFVLQIRDHCLTQLTKALQENAARTGTDNCTEEAAIALEYDVFSSVKTTQMYKLTIHRKVHKLYLLTVVVINDIHFGD